MDETEKCFERDCKRNDANLAGLADKADGLYARASMSIARLKTNVQACTYLHVAPREVAAGIGGIHGLIGFQMAKMNNRCG